MSINVNDKNLGHATAYAYYKAGGGTMTEAEFTEFMADFGTASQTAVEAAQAALASKNAAQTAATTATNKATEATTAATTATTKAGEASTSASTATSAKDTAVSASQTATSKATEATTAAATATSAKTDAVAANTAAQSAKTAAQTAQAGAETAAASVQSSAAQIQTNADDISELKEELKHVEKNVFDESVNMLNIANMTAGYLNAGILFSSDIYKTTEYINVDGATAVNFSTFLKQSYVIQPKPMRFVAFYTSKNESSYISQDSSNSTSVSIPQNAEYMRITISNDFIGDAFVPMLTEGTEAPTKVVPYINIPISKFNNLTGKTAVFFGDSVCYGDNWRPEETVPPRSNSGWAIMLQKRNKMINFGYGNSGAVYPYIEDYKNSIVSQFLTFNTYAGNFKPDYIILEGGINDAGRSVEIGTLTDTFTQPASYNTEYSALEYLLYNIKTKYPTTKVGVILPHHASGYAFQTALKEYISVIKTACEKWSVPYCDLYTKSQINGCIETAGYRDLFFDQWGVHPNEDGYEILTDTIENWMNEL